MPGVRNDGLRDASEQVVVLKLNRDGWRLGVDGVPDQLDDRPHGVILVCQTLDVIVVGPEVQLGHGKTLRATADIACANCPLGTLRDRAASRRSVSADCWPPRTIKSEARKGIPERNYTPTSEVRL